MLTLFFSVLRLLHTNLLWQQYAVKIFAYQFAAPQKLNPKRNRMGRDCLFVVVQYSINFSILAKEESIILSVYNYNGATTMALLPWIGPAIHCELLWFSVINKQIFTLHTHNFSFFAVDINICALLCWKHRFVFCLLLFFQSNPKLSAFAWILFFCHFRW